MSIKQVVVTVLVAAGLIVVPAGPARAANLTVAVSDTVLFRGCYDHPYTFTVGPGLHQSWRLELTVFDNGGNVVDTEIASGTVASSGTFVTSICSSDESGLWEVRSDLTLFGEGAPLAPSPDTFYFDVDPSKTQTELRVNDSTFKPGQLVRFTVISQDQQPGGYVRTPRAKVSLEVKVDRDWLRVPRSKARTDGRGKVIYRYRWGPRSTAITVRAVTKPRRDKRLGSHSSSVRIRGVR